MSNTQKFPSVQSGKKFSEVEKEILEFWKKDNTFQKSIERNPEDNEFVFFDGPPFATGTPHYGHILAGAIKDAIPRYKTMQGFRVNRKFGWDCHGVPVEFLIEKENNIGGKPGIEKMGTGPFNDLCQSAVMRCADEWESTVERMGRFVDFKNDYKTMDPDFMESVWSVFRELWNKDLIYEGEKVIAYSPKLGSPLSNFEAGQNYKDIDDPAITVKFPVVSGEFSGANFLAWTTTPWTMPIHTALCINKNLTYSVVESEKFPDEQFIVGSARVESIFGKDAKVLKEISGADLVGVEYEQPFDFFEPIREKGAFRVLEDDFVSADSGTGIVHLAPTGEDDARILQTKRIPLNYPFDDSCYFNFSELDEKNVNIEKSAQEKIAEISGKYFRKDETVEGSTEDNANIWVLEELKNSGKLFKREQIRHSYPHCWRTDCALMYRGIKTWFVDVQKIKKLMIEKNQEINWSPEHLKNGRFGNILETAPDWAISRNRYWGAPIPVWKCENEECDNIEVVSLRSELEEKTGKKAGEISDIHKQFVDDLTWECPKCNSHPDTLQNGEGEIEEKIPEELDQYLKNIDDMMTSISEENFRDFKLTIPVGRIPEKAAEKLKLADSEIFLSSFIYAKIRGWTNKNEGHDEITNLEYFLIPFLLEDPTIILEDKKHNLRFLVCEHEKRTLLLVVSSEKGRNEIVSYFYSHQGKMKDRTVIYKNEEGRTRGIPSWIHDKVTSLVLRLSQEDEKFSSRRILNYENFIELLQESQDAGNSASKMVRIPEVLDCWFESGAMPYASRGVHFQKMKNVEEKLEMKTPETKKEIEDYHQIAGNEIIEIYNLELKYDPNHPDQLRKDAIKKVFIFENQVIGMAFLYPKTDKRIFLGLFGIKKEFQQKGFGKIALHQLEKFLQNQGFEEIVLNANKKVLLFYQKNNYQKNFWTPDKKPMENTIPYGKKLVNNFSSQPVQADFIAEGLDQTRGWFYTLHVLGCALTGENIYKNVITNGIVLAEDGQKMSKSKKNYPDPNLIFDKYGADAMRFYMLSSPVVRAENFRFAENGVQEIVKTILLPLQNVYAFFSTYANIDGWQATNILEPKTDLDAWILSEYEKMRAEFTENFEAYKLDDALRNIPAFVDSLTNWFVRRSRDRFWESGMSVEKKSGYETLHFVLKNIAKILAPVCPFFAETLWQNCASGAEKTESVHLQNLADSVSEFLNEKLSDRINLLRDTIKLGASIRAKKKIKLRQPLAKLSFALSGKIIFTESDLEILKEESNVKEVVMLDNLEGLAKQIVKANARVVGKRFGKKTQEVIKAGKAGEFEILENGDIALAGEILSGNPELNEFEFGFETAEGIEGDGNRDAVVLLDTEISEELMLEGLSRELIRGIQEGRKSSGFQISDRISVKFSTDSENITKAYEKFGDVIDHETLTVNRQSIPESEFIKSVKDIEKIVKLDIDGEHISFELSVFG